MAEDSIVNDETRLPATGYISDATVNNAEILYGADRPNMASLVDLINVVQCAVMNERVIVSPMAMKRSSLLGELDFAGCFEVSTEEEDGETVTRIKSPLQVPEGGALIDVDEHGEPSASSAAGELLLATAWSEALQEDDVLGSLVLPERLAEDQPRGDAYFAKFTAFMCWLLADRGLMNYADEEARRSFEDPADKHLRLYRLLTRRLVSCRDRFGLDLICSVIEEPIFSLSVAQEVNEPLEYLEQFDAKVHEGIVAGRAEAFERWHFPAVGAAVLAKCKRIDELPKEIAAARESLLKARSTIRAMNVEIAAFEREMKLGNDAHFKELNRLKVALQRALQAFGDDTAYRADLEAFPVSDRIWWIPRILVSAVGAMKAPEKALAEISALPWVQRQRFLRHVTGMRNASSYVKSSRSPVMAKIIEDIGRLDWNAANVQCETLDWARDFIQRCCDLRTADEIGNKVLFAVTDEEGGEPVDVLENAFWPLLALNEPLRATYFPLPPR